MTAKQTLITHEKQLDTIARQQESIRALLAKVTLLKEALKTN